MERDLGPSTTVALLASPTRDQQAGNELESLGSCTCHPRKAKGGSNGAHRTRLLGQAALYTPGSLIQDRKSQAKTTHSTQKLRSLAGTGR